jgi:phage terminase large subunit GpA-like protein
MNQELKQELFKVYKEALQPPYIKGFKQWVEEFVVLPPAYAIAGRLDLSTSPYLHKPMEAIDNPYIMQVNLCMATQVGKTLVEELFIPYSIINAPGPVFRIFNNKEVSDVFAETRLIPLLKSCEPIKPLLKYDRFTTKKSGITLPHISVTLGSSNTALQHGMSVRYLLCDELHQWEAGQFNKFLARTTAFAGRRKVICSSQPSKKGHEWEQICYKGKVHEWAWLCPKCNTRQLFHWSKEKPDGTYAGFNWDTILNEEGATNIIESAKTTVLECINCDHHINDTPTERLYLNNTGEYICTKNDGDETVATFMAPCFVNPNITFASKAAEYMIAKRTKSLTGLDELMEIFVEQSLGKFYKREQAVDVSKILVELYDKDNLNNDWIGTMGIDVQRTQSGPGIRMAMKAAG